MHGGMILKGGTWGESLRAQKGVPGKESPPAQPWGLQKFGGGGAAGPAVLQRGRKPSSHSGMYEIRSLQFFFVSPFDLRWEMKLWVNGGFTKVSKSAGSIQRMICWWPKTRGDEKKP